jgi:hypothetical protein
MISSPSASMYKKTSPLPDRLSLKRLTARAKSSSHEGRAGKEMRRVGPSGARESLKSAWGVEDAMTRCMGAHPRVEGCYMHTRRRPIRHWRNGGRVGASDRGPGAERVPRQHREARTAAPRGLGGVILVNFRHDCRWEVTVLHYVRQRAAAAVDPMAV